MQKDLLIKTGHDLDDIGRTLSWGALGAFLNKLDADSELARELEPEIANWAGTVKTNAILADIYDVLTMINANICALGTGKRASKPKSYPRPGDNKKQHIGKNALPPDQLRSWFARRRKQRKEVNGND